MKRPNLIICIAFFTFSIGVALVWFWLSSSQLSAKPIDSSFTEETISKSILPESPTQPSSEQMKIKFLSSEKRDFNSDRDLSLYEQGKTYDFSLRKVKTLSAERQQFREFLWKQWAMRRRTKVTAKTYSSEGDPTTSTYYIEPNKNGNWQIVVESVSECCWFYAMRKPKKKVERRRFSTTYSELKRVQEIQNENGMFLARLYPN